MAARRVLAAEMMPASAELYAELSCWSVLVYSACGGFCADDVLRELSEAPVGTGATIGIAVLRARTVSGGAMPGLRAQRICQGGTSGPSSIASGMSVNMSQSKQGTDAPDSHRTTQVRSYMHTGSSVRSHVCGSATVTAQERPVRHRKRCVCGGVQRVQRVSRARDAPWGWWRLCRARGRGPGRSN